MPQANDANPLAGGKVFEQLGLIGCGLMGGSFALALKRSGRVKRVVGFSQSKGSIERACAIGAIDEAATSAQAAVTGSDLVLLAVPVAATHATLAAIQSFLEPNCLLMDVGSTKCDVVAAAHQTLGAKIACFVPAHPIAGREVFGIEHADAHLYENCQVILTPTEVTQPERIQDANALWSALGCRVRQMSAANHDKAYAAVSHLPHLLAFAMMQTITQQPLGQDFLTLAGPGFRDFTRIAASAPEVWRDILLANRQDVLAQCQHFQRQLQAFEKLLSQEDGQALEALIRQASLTRSNWTLSQPAS
jgi:prephenate dehydrogenase